jgi:hypothetical protein
MRRNWRGVGKMHIVSLARRFGPQFLTKRVQTACVYFVSENIQITAKSFTKPLACTSHLHLSFVRKPLVENWSH